MHHASLERVLVKFWALWVWALGFPATRPSGNAGHGSFVSSCWSSVGIRNSRLTSDCLFRLRTQFLSLGYSHSLCERSETAESRSLQNVLFTLTSPTKSSENTLLSSQLPSSHENCGLGLFLVGGRRFLPRPSLLNLLTYFPEKAQRGSKRRPVGSNSRDNPRPTKCGPQCTKVRLLELVPVLPKDVVVARRRAAGNL